MSKELEALERIKTDLEYITRLDYVEPVVRGEVRDQLYKIYHRELPELDLIETALKELEIKREAIGDILAGNEEKKFKVLNIIKEKDVDVGWLKRAVDLYQYNNGVGISSYSALTKEEYGLLKEVLL